MMRLISRYKQLSSVERRLFFRAMVFVVAIRMGLSVLPFRVTRNWVESLSKPAGPWRDLDHRSIRQVAWAVEAACRRVPRATCLTQGMATQGLLARMGQKSELRLGVARKVDGQLEAHAWVETRGRIISGGAVEGFHRYARLEKSPT